MEAAIFVPNLFHDRFYGDHVYPSSLHGKLVDGCMLHTQYFLTSFSIFFPLDEKATLVLKVLLHQLLLLFDSFLRSFYRLHSTIIDYLDLFCFILKPDVVSVLIQKVFSSDELLVFLFVCDLTHCIHDVLSKFLVITLARLFDHCLHIPKLELMLHKV